MGAGKAGLGFKTPIFNSFGVPPNTAVDNDADTVVLDVAIGAKLLENSIPKNPA
jgi:hypothetical protein